MGDFFLRPDPSRPGEFRWEYDENAPSPTPHPSQPRTQHSAESPRPGDIGDWIDPNAPDPTPDEVVDRGHPDYVDPWFGA